MSKIIPNIATSDTFLVWLQRTNDLVDELGSSIVTASVSGNTTVGSATLTGNFTANTIFAESSLRTDSISSYTSGNTITIESPVDFNSTWPKDISITHSSGPRLLFDNTNINWNVGIRGSGSSGTSAEFIIQSGDSGFPLRLSPEGILYANTLILSSSSNTTTAAVRSDRSITGSSGITGGGNLTDDRVLSLTGNPLSLFNLSANGIITKTASGTVTARTLVAGNGVVITNANGVAGNPTISVDTSILTNIGDQTLVGNLVYANTLTMNSNVFFNANTYWGAQDRAIFNTDKMEIWADNVHGRLSVKNNLYVDMETSGVFHIRNSINSSVFTFDANTQILSVTGDITASGDVSAYSDSRLKNDVRTIDNALEKVSMMRGVYFVKDGVPGTGVIAQEIEHILPEVVKDTGEYKSVAYGNIVGILIEAIKELQARIKVLEQNK